MRTKPASSEPSTAPKAFTAYSQPIERPTRRTSSKNERHRTGSVAPIRVAGIKMTSAQAKNLNKWKTRKDEPKLR
jgi:hypothetical protein